MNEWPNKDSEMVSYQQFLEEMIQRYQGRLPLFAEVVADGVEQICIPKWLEELAERVKFTHEQFRYQLVMEIILEEAIIPYIETCLAEPQAVDVFRQFARIGLGLIEEHILQ